MECIYKIGEKEFSTLEELSDFVSTQGFDALGIEDPTAKAKVIIERFRSPQESAAEMIARLNFMRDNPGVDLPLIDKNFVNSQIYPKGQMNDYLVQSDIHRNTYSGVRTTGIAANSGKMSGYMFESTPISLLRDGETTFPPSAAVLSQYGVASVNELLERFPSIKIEARETPSLKAGYHIKFGDRIYKGLSRLEDRGDNIFELIDMIINLAIDNVKEQKLFVLGITNSNANAFLSAITLGINLRDIVRLFSTPTIAELSKKNRIRASDLHNIARQAKEGLNVDTFSDVVEEYFNGSVPTSISNILTSTKSKQEIMDTILEQLSPAADVLDRVYVRNASPSLKSLSDYLAAQQIAKLVSIGEEYFVYSQLFTLLKRLPASKGRIDYLVTKVQQYSALTYLSTTKKVIEERVLNDARALIEDSELFQNLLEVNPEEAEKLLNQEMRTIGESVVFSSITNSRSKQWLNNRVMRRQAPMHISTTAESVFTNVTPLSIPHVYSAYKALLVLKNILESAFFVYSPQVQTFASKLLEDSGLINKGTKTLFEYSLIDGAAKEFVKYLNSSLELNIDGQTVSIDSATTNATALVRGITYNGVEGWSQVLIRSLSKLTKSDNEFLANLEIYTDQQTGLSKLKFTADKVADNEIRERIKAGYENLYEENPELALDIFKYAILSQGLYYGRTSIGRVFPQRFVVAFSRAMEDRLSLIKGSSEAEFVRNLNVIKDQFTQQYLASRVESLPYVRGIKAVKLSNYRNSSGSTRNVMKGVDKVNEQEVYYDLKYPKKEEASFPTIIKHFGNNVYHRLNVPSDDYVYYRIINSKNFHHTYTFRPTDLSTGLNINPVLDPSKNVLYSYTSLSDSQFEYVGPQVVEENKEVYLMEKAGSLPYQMRHVRIGKVQPIQRGDAIVAHRYTFTTIATISLDNKAFIERENQFVPLIEQASLASSVSVLPISKIIARKSKTTLKVISDTTDSPIDETSIVLPINQLTALEGEAFNTALNNLLDKIKAIPVKMRYVVQENILEPLRIKDITAARLVANALHQRISYVDPLVDDLQSFNIEDRLFAELDFMLNGNKTLPYESLTIEGPIYKISLDDVGKSIERRIKVGKMLKIGYSTNGPIYGYVKSIDDGVITMTTFGETTLREIKDSTYPPSQFEEILEKTNPC